MANIDWNTTSRFSAAGDSPGLSLWRQFHSWQRKINAALGPLQLTQMQFSLIAVIGYLTKDGNEITQQDVARFAEIDRMLVSQVVRRLADEGLVKRCPHANDKRAWSLSLTRRGANKLAKAVPIVEAADEEFFR